MQGERKRERKNALNSGSARKLLGPKLGMVVSISTLKMSENE
jgi:hypothetical protein